MTHAATQVFAWTSKKKSFHFSFLQMNNLSSCVSYNHLACDSILERSLNMEFAEAIVHLVNLLMTWTFLQCSFRRLVGLKKLFESRKRSKLVLPNITQFHVKENLAEVILTSNFAWDDESNLVRLKQDWRVLFNCSYRGFVNEWDSIQDCGSAMQVW